MYPSLKLTLLFTHSSEDNALPDGTYPIKLSQDTQERFECIAEWDLSALEPHKIVSIEKIKEDLQQPDSDFQPLMEQIKVRNFISLQVERTT